MTRTSQTVEDWLAANPGWDGDIYCVICREKLLYDATPIGFHEKTGERLHRRKGVCPRASWWQLGLLHTTDGTIISPPPANRRKRDPEDHRR